MNSVPLLGTKLWVNSKDIQIVGLAEGEESDKSL